MLLDLFKKIQADIEFRIKLFLLLLLILNLGYASFLFVVSKIYSSQWFFVMAIYYALLSTARIFMFFGVSSNSSERKKLLIMRTCGGFLLLLNAVVSVMIFLLIYTTTFGQYNEIIVITLAAYSFISLTVAIIGFVRFWRKDNYVYFCIKAISLISVSVSMLTLTNTMLATFGEDNAILRSIILPVFSAVVSIFIIVCAVFMIKKANYQLRMLKNEET